MKFKLSIELTNTAFVDFMNSETARILKDLANHIHGAVDLNVGMEGPLYDWNGNKVGIWIVEENK